MKHTYNLPAGIIPGLYADIMQQPHVLIAGSTGSGKSVAVNGLIYSLLYFSPAEKQLVLLDPKRVELQQYRNLPHCMSYNNTPETCAAALQALVKTMEKRFAEMEKTGSKLYNGSDIYCIIDEWVDIRQTTGKDAEKDLIRLSAMARAAKIHIILCTQRPTSDILNGAIRANFTCKLALRCNSRQESRNAMDCTGAEMLPAYGYGYYRQPAAREPLLSAIPFYTAQMLSDMVHHWEKQKTRPNALQRLTSWIK